MLALQEHPGQKSYLLDDFDARIGAATDEFVRWASPVQTFKRTTRERTSLGDVEIDVGEKVVMFYGSGNRDERAFNRPLEFDVSRRPNKHVGFGGGGPHYCLGAMLAKTQLQAIVDQLLQRVPALELGRPDYLVSNFVHGIKSMPCTV
jgi:cytochrome P450